MFLINWSIERGSVNFARGSDDDAPRFRLPAGFQNVQRAANVRRHIRSRRGVGIGYANEGREVQHHVAARDEVPHKKGVRHIAKPNVEMAAQFLRNVAQVPPITAPIVASQRTHFMPLTQEQLGKMAADESTGASDKNLHLLD